MNKTIEERVIELREIIFNLAGAEYTQEDAMQDNPVSEEVADKILRQALTETRTEGEVAGRQAAIENLRKNGIKWGNAMILSERFLSAPHREVET